MIILNLSERLINLYMYNISREKNKTKVTIKLPTVSIRKLISKNHKKRPKPRK